VHEGNKKKLKEQIVKLCNDADLVHYSGNNADVAPRIWWHLWRKIRYAGITNTTASKEIEDIAFYFDNYENFCDPTWDIEAKGHTLIRTGINAKHFLDRTGPFAGKQTIGNLPKLVKTVKVARQLCQFMASKDASKQVIDFVTEGRPTTEVWPIHEYLMGIGYTADLTALHFMMDLGFPVIKPDIVITRLFLRWGWLHKACPDLPADLSPDDLRGNGKHKSKFKYDKPRIYKPVIELARQIVVVTDPRDLTDDLGWKTDNLLREFDIFTVLYGQVPDKD
jgi:hypothetical protein